MIDLSLLTKGGFCQLPQNDRSQYGHIGQYFTLSARLQELRSSEQFLEGQKQPWKCESKGRKCYIITFSTFPSQHFDQERVSFSKVNMGAHAN